MKPAQTITVGMREGASNALILLADEKDYFNANGLDISIKLYPSGLASVNGMLQGEVDVATAAEFVIVGKALAGEPIRTWGSIDKFTHNYVFARKDRGIATVNDLRGKTIGVPLGTASEFYLGRFLELNGIPLQEVTQVNVDPTDLVRSVVSGEVDGVIAWQPNAKMVEDQLGEGVVRWPAQSERASYWNLISTETWTSDNADAVQHFLRALADAEDFYTENPTETQAILQKRLAYDPAYMAAIWPEHQFQLSLEEAMILSMEDETRWMMKNQLTQASNTPDFLNFLYWKGMESVRPDAVNIIH